MIMDGANVIASGYITPDANNFKHYVGVENSVMLRFGVESSFFLVLFIGQVCVCVCVCVAKK
jgi:meckelin